MGEVIEQMQLIVDIIGTGPKLSLAEIGVVLSRHAPADSLAAIGGIERPEIAGDEAFRNGAQRYVCRVGPVQVIDRAGQGKTVGAVTAAIAQDRVFFTRVTSGTTNGPS
jgi:hypothetical protein